MPEHDPSAAAAADTPAPPAPVRSARATVEGLLAATVGEDPGAIADFYAPHVVIEMPFAPAALHPARIETTREELRTRFRAGTAVRRYDRLREVRVHETADPEVVVAEYVLDGHLVVTDAALTLSFAMVLTVRDGCVVHSRDYADPLEGARALGRLPALLASLAGDAAPAEPAGRTGAAGPPFTAQDRVAITELLALHGHLADAGALDRLGEVFSQDVTYDLTGVDPAYGVLRGLEPLRAAAGALGAGNPVGHHVTNAVLDPLPDGRVAVRSKGIGVRADGSCGSVTYEDIAARGPDGWRITHRRVLVHRAPLGAG
jgi:ketosteroid isomerase-like protein